MNERRPYRSPVREERAAATRRRIVDAARELFVDPVRDFTLERTAVMAGVSVQTVLRAFGSKEGLILDAIGTFRLREGRVLAGPARSVGEAVTVLFEDYEQIGDRVIRMLADEHRIPGFAEVAAGGRESHRSWVEATFSTQLAALPARQRDGVVMALIAATDVYVWKLLRRDLGLDRKAAEAVMVRLIRGALVSNSSHGKEE